MQHLRSRKRNSLALLGIALLASLALAACGSSSSSSGASSSTSSPGASASSTNPAGGSGASGRSGRFAALRECLAKNGITLPKRTPGQRGSFGLLGGGAPALPQGVTRAQYEAALKKCGGGLPRGGRFKGFAGNPAAKQGLKKFAVCMREHGVELPEPNTSGTGPVFDTKGIDTTSATFKAADSSCAADLHSGFAGHRPTGQSPRSGSYY